MKCVINDLSKKYLSIMKTKSFIELSRIKDYQGEKISHEKKTYTVAVWKDMINAHELRIVVQTYRYWFLGIGKMDAEGFIINSDNMINDLTKEELYDFI